MSEPAVVLPLGVSVLERGWLSSNNLVLSGRHGTAVVDTGYATHDRQTVALVSRALGERPLEVVANTHLHSDHCGGNAALRERWPGLRILIPPGQADAVVRWDVEALSYAPTGQQCPPFRHDGLLVPGHEVALGDQHWQIFAAPGHDPDAVVLFEPVSRTLVSGDALWENGFGVIFPELEGEPGVDDVAATLDLIASLDPAVVVPGHGRPFAEVRIAIAGARQKLDRFARDPRKHAHHASKVLLKFKMLEQQTMARAALRAWARRTRHFTQVHHSHFDELTLDTWFDQLVAELIQSGALALQTSLGDAESDQLVNR